MSRIHWLIAAGIMAGLLIGATYSPNAPADRVHRAFGGIMPRISPDGKKIVLSYQGMIGVMSGEGGDLKILTHAEGFDIEPCWSPDASHIAFIRAGGGYADGTLMVINAEDGRELKLGGSVRVHTINGPELGSTNTFADPERVTTRETSVELADHRSHVHTLEPHSVTGLVFGL